MSAGSNADLARLAAQPFGLLVAMEESLRESRQSVQGSSGDNTWQGLAFRVRGHWLVCPSSDVKEYLAPPPLTRAPGSKSWFAGMGNLRGSLLPVTDLGKLLEIDQGPEGADRKVIVVKSDTGPVGILVDEIAGYRRFTPDDEREGLVYPEAFAIGQLGVMHREGRSWLAFSLQKLIRSDRFTRAGI